MSGIAKQPPSSFQQLRLLRKILIKKDSGKLSYVSQSGHHGEIVINKGSFVDASQVSKELPIFFSEAVKHCSWKRMLFGNSPDLMNPIEAICLTINDIQWNHATIMLLKRLFSKLPAVRIRMVPLYRYKYNDGLTYLVLYQQAIKTHNFLLKDFLSDNDIETLKPRVKVLVLGYCLGLITAIPKQNTTTNNKNSNVGIAARILRRIRGI